MRKSKSRTLKDKTCRKFSTVDSLDRKDIHIEKQEANRKLLSHRIKISYKRE